MCVCVCVNMSSIIQTFFTGLRSEFLFMCVQVLPENQSTSVHIKQTFIARVSHIPDPRPSHSCQSLISRLHLHATVYFLIACSTQYGNEARLRFEFYSISGLKAWLQCFSLFLTRFMAVVRHEDASKTTESLLCMLAPPIHLLGQPCSFYTANTAEGLVKLICRMTSGK